jgi:hypothetical protein
MWEEATRRERRREIAAEKDNKQERASFCLFGALAGWYRLQTTPPDKRSFFARSSTYFQATAAW